MADLTKTIKILFEGTDKTGPSIKSVSKGLESLGGNIRSSAQPLADLTTAVAGLDVALVSMAGAGIAYAYKESSKLQSAFTELKKVAGDNVDVLDVAKSNAKELSNAYGESADSILSATANYVQAGFSVNESMQLAKDGMDLVIAGGVEASQASEILIASLKGFREPASEAGRLLDILNEVSNNYATDVEQLGVGMAKLSPIARSMGFSMEETAGVITPIIEIFRSGDEAATALKTGLLKLVDDARPVKDALASIGVSQTDANGALRSGKDILADVSNAFLNLDQNQKLFVTQQLVGIEQSARMVEVFDNLGKSSEITATAMNSAGSAAKEVAARLLDPEVAIKRLAVSFNNAASSIGDDFQLAGTGVLNGFASIFSSIQKSADKGAFAPLVDALNNVLDGIRSDLEGFSAALPDALSMVDYSGFIDSLGEIKDLVGSLFDDVDLSVPESIAQAIQKIVDTLESISSFSAGIGAVFVNLGGYISDLIDWFNGLDDSTKEILGVVSGLGAAISAVAVPISIAVTAVGGLTAALIAAAAAGSAFVGLEIAGAINKDLYGVDSVMTSLEKSAASLKAEIEKLDGTNATLYKFFKGDDKEVVLDELRTKLQLVNDKIAIVKAEANGENIFAGIEDDAASLKNALEHIAPRFEEVENSAEELKSALEHNTPKFDINISDAESKLQTIDIWRESSGTWETIKIPVDSKSVDDAKKAIDSIPAVKRLEIETDLEIAKVKADAAIVQDSLKFKAQVDIANIEASTKQLESVAKNISAIFQDTGKVITGLFSSWDPDASLSKIWAIQDSLRDETENRKKALEMQEKLNDAEIEYLKMKAQKMKDGGSVIKVSADGLQPHLEMILWEIFKAIQIRALEDGPDKFLGE
jgi:TP901 family phage tail tape measure protein